MVGETDLEALTAYGGEKGETRELVLSYIQRRKVKKGEVGDLSLV